MNQQPLFENPDCALQAGSTVGLLGKNGAGTALLKLMTELLRRTEGKVCIMGYQPTKNKSAEHCNKIRGKSSSH